MASYRDEVLADTPYIFYDFNEAPKVLTLESGYLDSSAYPQDYSLGFYNSVHTFISSPVAVDHGASALDTVRHGSLIGSQPYNSSVELAGSFSSGLVNNDSHGIMFGQVYPTISGRENSLSSDPWTNFAAEGFFYCTYPAIASLGMYLFGSDAFSLAIRLVGPDLLLQLKLYGPAGFSTPVTLTGTTPLAVATLYHFAVEYSGNTWTIFINGVQEATFTQGTILELNNSGSPLYIGLSGAFGEASNISSNYYLLPFKGYVDGFVFYHHTVGAARFLAHYVGRTAATTDSPKAPENLHDTAHTSTTIDLAVDPFFDADPVVGATRHASTKWQIATDPDFVNIIYDSGFDAVNKLTIHINPPLVLRTDYYTRALFKDTAARVSLWSSSFLFTTKIAPTKPTITVDEITSDTARLTGSAFSDPDNAGHNASQWQLDYDDVISFTTEIEVDTGATNTLTQITLGNLAAEPSNARILLYSTNYAKKVARVRYRDNDGLWSDWSDPIHFVIPTPGTDAIIARIYLSKTPILLMPLDDTNTGVGASIVDISGNGHNATVMTQGEDGEGSFLSAGPGVVVGQPDTNPGPVPDVYFPLRKWLGKSMGFTGGQGNWLRIPHGAWMDLDNFAVCFNAQRMNTTGRHPIVGWDSSAGNASWFIRFQGTTLIASVVDTAGHENVLSASAPYLDRTLFVCLRKIGTAVDFIVGDPVAQTLQKTSYVIPNASLDWHVAGGQDLLIGTDFPASGWHTYGVANYLALYPGLTDQDVLDLWNGYNSTGPHKPTITVQNIRSRKVDLVSSAFATDDVGVAHKSSSWQIDVVTGDYTNSVFSNIRNAVRKLLYPDAGPLAPVIAYRARVQHTDTFNVDGPWSDSFLFTTLRDTLVPPPEGVITTIPDTRVTPVLVEVESCPPNRDI
jgi:hypothetical protein